MAEDWQDDAARRLERFFGGPMADAVPVTAHVVSRSEPKPRGRYQICRLELLVEADDVPALTLRVEAVIERGHWPEVGATLPALMSRTDPGAVEIDWDRLRPSTGNGL